MESTSPRRAEILSRRFSDPPSTSIEMSADRKSTRLNSSHGYISYAVFCLKKKTLLPDRGPGHYLHLLQTARADLARHLDNPDLSANDVALLRSLTAQCDVIEAHWCELYR